MGLDDELRELFASDRMDVPVRPDAEHIIVTGARRVRRRRIAAAAAGGAVVMIVFAGVALAGGQSDDLPPATRKPTTPATTSAELAKGGGSSTPENGGTEEEPENPPPEPDPTEETETSTRGPVFPVIGPTGFHGLELGQTLEEVQATGMLGDQTASNMTCDLYHVLLDGAAVGYVYVSDTVQVIVGEMETPEGIGPGSTLDQAKALYPDLEVQPRSGDRYPGLASVPGNGNARYRLMFGDDDVVIAVSLEAADQTCV